MNRRQLIARKLLMSLLGIGILAGMWQWSTWNLYSLPADAITAYTSITNNCFYAIVVLVVWFVTGHLVMDWKNTTSSAVTQVGQEVHEKVEEEKIFRCENLDPKDLDAEAFD